MAMDAKSLERLGHMQVLVLDSDKFALQLTRKTLSTLGITNTTLLRDAQEAMDVLNEKTIDTLVVDWDVKPFTGIELVKRLRSPGSFNRMIPVIFTTAHTDEESMEIVRNSGVNEIITKPFNVRAMMDAFTRVVEAPKPFIITDNYVGPDRRDPNVPVPPEILRMRKTVPQVVNKNMANEVFIDGMPRMIMPDKELRQKLESATSRMAGLENLLSADEVVKREQDFVQWMLKDVENLRQAFRQMKHSPDNARYYAERMEGMTVNIRSRAITCNYIFASRVATGLHDFLQKKFNPQDTNHYTVIEKYLMTLQAILAHRITGDEDATGRELMEELRKLALRYT